MAIFRIGHGINIQINTDKYEKYFLALYFKA